MNKEEILNKYIDLIDKGYCCDCNELNCIDNFPHAKITHAIRELQQQCKKQKEAIDKAIEFSNKNWGTWCTHHLEYMTELQNILKEVE